MIDDQLRGKLVEVLMRIYTSDNARVFIRFLEGEQVVLTILKNFNVNTPTEICQISGIAKNRMSAIINSLKLKGNITVDIDKFDRRKLKLSLTEYGNKFITEKMEIASSILDKFIHDVGNEKAGDLVNILNLGINNWK